jgi:hypothetical protein
MRPGTRIWPHWRLERYVVALSMAVAAIVVGVGTTAAAGSHARLATNKMSDMYHGVNQVKLQECIRTQGNCLQQVPGLVQCLRVYHRCNDISPNPAESDKSTHANSDGTLVTEQQALSEVGWTGENVSAELTTYGQAQALAPSLAASDLIDPSTPVWVLTLYQQMTVPLGGMWGPPSAYVSPGGSVPTVSIDAASVVIDAESGIITDSCDGCAALPEASASTKS